MITGLLFLNQRGETVISRFYRDAVSTEDFRARVIAAKQTAEPIIHIGDASYLYTRVNDVFVVAMTQSNVNPALVFQFIFKLLGVFRSYFGGKIDEETLRNNFVLIYELLDEAMDNGYPQITAVELLKSYIKIGDVKMDPNAAASKGGITSEITGAVDWRQAGKYKYRKNQVFIDVYESVNLLMSNKGTVLRADVSGQIKMKTYLSGMPECKLGLNDKLVMEKEARNSNRRRHGSGIAIDDVTFHRCVKLGQFDHDRTVSFVPPDGEFELMKYRITQHVNLPFRVIPVVTMHGRNRVEYEISIKGNFATGLAGNAKSVSGPQLFANNVILKIPCPKNTAKCTIQTGLVGKAKYSPGQNAIVWKIKKFPGGAYYTLKGEVSTVASLAEQQWSRPPITVEFNVPMFTASGLHVRFLKVLEREGYETIKWVLFNTRAGQYQIRI